MDRPMIDARTKHILTYIARDLDVLIAPELSSPRAKFAAGAMKSLLDGIVAAVPSPSAGARNGLDLKELVALEEAARPDAGGAREAAYRQSGSGLRDEGPGEAALGPITADMLIAALRGRDGYAWVEAADVVQAPGGFSKETYLATLQGAGRSEDIVMRRDPAFSPLASTVAEEFPLLNALRPLNLPIPHLSWLETDPAAFGAPVVAMARLPGSADVSKWSGEPALARQVIDRAAHLLARLHQPDVLDIFSPRSAIPGASGDTPGAMVEDLHRFWTGLGFSDEPLVDAVFDWLRSNAPPAFVRRALLHGDFGFHNLLVHDGDITGLLDWEFSHVGDVAEDLAYARPFVEQVVPWAEFDTLYRSYGGAGVPRAAVDFWGVFGLMRIGLGCYATIGQIDRGNMSLDAKAAYVGQSFAKPFVIDAAKLVLKQG